MVTEDSNSSATMMREILNESMSADENTKGRNRS